MNKKKILCWRMLLLVSIAFAAFQAKAVFAEDQLTVSDVSTADATAYALSWTEGLGQASVSRSSDGGKTFEQIGTTDYNFYVDRNLIKDKTYSYKVTSGLKELSVSTSLDQNGKPNISGIKIESGATSKTEASVIVNFNTDILSKAQLFYGETSAYGSQTELDSSLNQGHTLLIEKLKPSTIYHLKINAISKDGKEFTESEDQIFTTSNPPKDRSIIQVIIDALTKAFEGFSKWLNS